MENINLYVSPKGNDKFPGTISEVSDNDGPFKTIQRAVKKLKGLKRNIKVATLIFFFEKVNMFLKKQL